MARIPSTNKDVKNSKTYLEKIETDLKSNQSRLSLILGALIVLVVGILVFNYFNKPQSELGPSQTSDQTQQEDVTPDKLPGKYTVKEGDTLFLIAVKYYEDGFKFEELVKSNNLTDSNTIVVGQVLEIPKLAETPSSPTPPAAETTPPGEQPQTPTPAVTESSTTDWGPAITGTTYTVVEGDWLSTIAARAYGDILAYQNLARVNNIPNPDLIFPGQVLNIPR